MLIDIEGKPFLQLIFILCLCFISVILFSIVGGLIAYLAYGVDGLEINNLGNPNTIKGLKILQLFTAGGLFVVAPIVYAMISSKNLTKKISLINTSKPINYLLIFGLMAASIPFLSLVIEFNGNIVLPEFLSGIEQWFKIKQEEALIMQKAFLTFEGIGELIVVIVLIVIIPAFGEELLFRGVLQKIFISWSNNHHIGIWITAFLFGLLHMQFYSFLPITLLGAMFGYVFYWSKSLWLPILGHFINNGSVLFLSYFIPESMEDAEFSIFEESGNGAIIYLVSLIFSAIIFYLIKKVNQKTPPNNQNQPPISV